MNKNINHKTQKIHWKLLVKLKDLYLKKNRTLWMYYFKKAYSKHLKLIKNQVKLVKNKKKKV